jgi:hypothetical protein
MVADNNTEEESVLIRKIRINSDLSINFNSETWNLFFTIDLVNKK